MRQEPCQANGYVRPADVFLKEAVNAVMRSWCLAECAVLEEAGLLRIAFEGVTFPLDEILDAVRPYLVETSEDQLASSGTLDVYDLENWTLTRAEIAGSEIRVSTVGMNHVLEYSGF